MTYHAPFRFKYWAYNDGKGEFPVYKDSVEISVLAYDEKSAGEMVKEFKRDVYKLLTIDKTRRVNR